MGIANLINKTLRFVQFYKRNHETRKKTHNWAIKETQKGRTERWLRNNYDRKFKDRCATQDTHVSLYRQGKPKAPFLHMIYSPLPSNVSVTLTVALSVVKGSTSGLVVVEQTLIWKYDEKLQSISVSLHLCLDLCVGLRSCQSNVAAL